MKDYLEASVPQFSVGEYWDTMAYDWDGTPAHNQVRAWRGPGRGLALAVAVMGAERACRDQPFMGRAAKRS